MTEVTMTVTNGAARRRVIGALLALAGAVGVVISAFTPLATAPLRAYDADCDADPDCVEVAIAKKTVDDADTDGSDGDNLAVTSPASWDWVVSVVNYDTDETALVEVIDSLPAGVTVSSLAPIPSGTCNLSGSTITCSVDVAPQASWELTVSVTSSTPGVHTNDVEVRLQSGSSQTLSVDSVLRSSSDWKVVDDAPTGTCTGCAASPQITKSVVSQGPFGAGDPVEFELTVSGDLVNFMPWLVVTDVLDAGFVFDSFTVNPDGACAHDGSPSGGTISCTFTDTASGHGPDPGDQMTWLSGKFSTTVRFVVRPLGPGPCPNAAHLALGFWREDSIGQLREVTEPRDSDEVVVDVEGDGPGRGCRQIGGSQPDDIAVSKGLLQRDQATEGLRWAVTVSNVGSTPAYRVSLTDVLPETLEFVEVEPPHDGACVFSDLLNPAPGGGQVDCVLPEHSDPDDTSTWLQPGESVTVVLATRPSGQQAAGERDCRNVAEVALQGPNDPVKDTDPSNNLAEAVFDDPTIGCRAGTGSWDASVSKTASASADGGVTFDLTVTNVGSTGIAYIELVDNLPETVRFVSVDAPYDSVCSFEPGGGPGGGTLVCDLPVGSSATEYTQLLEPGESITVRVRTEALQDGAGCLNRAEITTYAIRTPPGRQDPYSLEVTPDDDTSNNVATVRFEAAVGPCSSGDGGPGDDPDDPTGAPVLQLDKQVESASVLVGEPFSYRLVYRNVGDSDATDVTVTDHVPSGLRIVEVSEGCSVDAQHVACVDPLVPPGVERAFVVTVVPSFEGEFVNEARVTSREGDPEVDDGGTPTDQVTVEVRRSTTPVPGTTGPDPADPAVTGTGRLPTTGGSIRLVGLASSLAMLGGGLVLLVARPGSAPTVSLSVHNAAWRRRRSTSCSS